MALYYDGESPCLVDFETRVVTIPGRYKVLAAKGDNVSNIITFKTPVKFRGFDLTDPKNVNGVVWVAADGSQDNSPLTLAAVEGDFAYFTWLVPDAVAVEFGGVDGTLYFSTIEKVIENGVSVNKPTGVLKTSIFKHTIPDSLDQRERVPSTITEETVDEWIARIIGKLPEDYTEIVGKIQGLENSFIVTNRADTTEHTKIRVISSGTSVEVPDMNDFDRLSESIDEIAPKGSNMFDKSDLMDGYINSSGTITGVGEYVQMRSPVDVSLLEGKYIYSNAFTNGLTKNVVFMFRREDDAYRSGYNDKYWNDPYRITHADAYNKRMYIVVRKELVDDLVVLASDSVPTSDPEYDYYGTKLAPNALPYNFGNIVDVIIAEYLKEHPFSTLTDDDVYRIISAYLEDHVIDSIIELSEGVNGRINDLAFSENGIITFRLPFSDITKKMSVDAFGNKGNNSNYASTSKKYRFSGNARIIIETSSEFTTYICSYSSDSDNSFISRTIINDTSYDLDPDLFYLITFKIASGTITDEQVRAWLDTFSIVQETSIGILYKKYNEQPSEIDQIKGQDSGVKNDIADIKSRFIDTRIDFDSFFLNGSLWSYGQIDISSGKDFDNSNKKRLRSSVKFSSEYDEIYFLSTNATGYIYVYDSDGNFAASRVPIVLNSPMPLLKGNQYRFLFTKTTDWDIDTFIATDYFTVYCDKRSSYFYGNDIKRFRVANPVVYDFMTTVEYDSSDYSVSHVFSKNQPYRADRPIPVIIKVDFKPDAVTSYIVYSDNMNSVNYDSVPFQNKVEVPYGATRVQLYNLTPNTTYYYKVAYLYADGTIEKTGIESFVVDNACTTRMIYVDGINNVRDIGGYACDNGFVSYGKIFRSSAFDEAVYSEYKITDKGVRNLLIDCGIRAELDLRNSIQQADLGYGVDFKAVQFPYYSTAINAATYGSVWREAFDYIVAELSQNKPVIYHCQGGCDRTGTLTVVLQAVLGVSESNINKEYELTSGFEPRRRNSTDFDFSGLMHSLKTYSNGSLKENAIRFLKDCGVTESNIQSFNAYMKAN